MRKYIVLGVVALWTVVYFILNAVGTLQTARDLFRNRGEIVRVAGTVLTSQWFPLALFLLAVAVVAYFHFRPLMPPANKAKTARAHEAKKQSFMIDYERGNCFFFTLSTSDARLNGRKALCVYDIKVVNNTGGSSTLKEVLLAYEHRNDNVKRERLGTVLPAGKLKDGQSAMLLFSSNAQILLSSWQDIRLVIGENEPKVAGAIWRGSAVFIFNEDVKSSDDVVNPRLITRDYLNQESQCSISPISRTDLQMRDEPFVQESDNSFRWVKRKQ
jgi:hypothetical protein